MLEALLLQYQADIAKAKANIQVYLDNPVGIGEHPDLVSAVDSQIAIIANAEDKINMVGKYYGQEFASIRSVIRSIDANLLREETKNDERS